MPNIRSSSALQMVRHGVVNLLRRRPLAVSFEVIHSCNCNCQHCDKGGMIPNETLAPPARFGDWVRELKPLIAQISGGEPLLRADIFAIIREMKHWGKLPYLVFVTNGWLLTEEKYHRLKQEGIDEFSISLDFPDSRHDDNRGIPGLFAHLNELLPKLSACGNNDITLISVIRSESLSVLRRLAEQAQRWQIAINFSSYTPLRTHDATHSVRGEEQLQALHRELDALIQFKRDTGRIFTAESVLNRYYEFFANDSQIPSCRAGYRSLVVNPDGRLAPCAMQPCSFESLPELVDQFSAHNDCGGCYVSMRANTEKSVRSFIKDGWQSLRQMRRNNGAGHAC